jgi:hypothetical protein
MWCCAVKRFVPCLPIALPILKFCAIGVAFAAH